MFSPTESNFISGYKKNSVNGVDNNPPNQQNINFDDGEMDALK